jgi:DNA-binding CsgD family transcriptional regulator
MSPGVRAAWHRDAARALAREGAPARRVARQLLPALDAMDRSAARDEWIVDWLAGAAQQLVGLAPRATIQLLRWAVAGTPTGGPWHAVLTCRLADAHYRAGDAAAAASIAEAALSHVTRPELLVDLHWTLAQCRAMEGRSEESLAALEQALATPGIGPSDRARLMVLTARTQRSLGRLDAASRFADEALTAAGAVGDRWATGWALGVMTLIHVMRGETAAALPLFDRALAVAEGDPALADLRLMMQINQATALADLDRYADAICAAEQVRQRADKAGNAIRLAQAQSVLGELLFDVGRWDDALATVRQVAGGPKEPFVECCDHGIAAIIQLHRGEAAARQHLAEAEQYAARLGEDRVVGSLALARSLSRECAEAPTEALAVLMDGLSETAGDLEQTTELLADAVRLAVLTDDAQAARTVVDLAETVADSSEVPHRRALAPHCRGLVDRDPVRLVRAADLYQAAGRPLPRAQALEAAGVALAELGDVAGARTRFGEAFSLYSDLGAGWDLARTQATFRSYGIRRGPRGRHRRTHQGWASLTPTELKVVALVADGLSNPQIGAQLFLSKRTVQTHVSHILAKLDLSSRIDIAREASRRATALDQEAS